LETVRTNFKDLNMSDGNNQDDIFSKAVRAGKRTYFFDVKTTRGNDLYLTITESKRKYDDDGNFSYEKHKLFLYKEDFDKFSDGLVETVDKIKELQASGNYSTESPMDKAESTEEISEDTLTDEEFSDVKFEDL
tara:strand:- start:1972 stop:2373 length:402 start_codon:yes stop_codon:yes gene_type:complete